MNKLIKISCLVGIALSLLGCSWYVLHNDIFFYTDIARDFFLFQEIATKKFVLLGPKSSTTGLFHGPLWMYLNFPAFFLGRGNPVVVGWFWILLIAGFLLSSFVIAKKLFNDSIAYIYTLLLAISLIFVARGLYNPYGAFFLIPSFFYFLVKYFEKHTIRSLLFFLLIAGCIIQFEMAIGIPFLLLAIPVVLLTIFKHKLFIHLLGFAILFLPLSTFILFDIRHQFLQLHGATSYLFGSQVSHQYGNYWNIIMDRVTVLTSGGMGFFQDGYWYKNHITFLLVLGLILLSLFKKQNRTVYGIFAYLYFGYFALSILNKSGLMLLQYYMPLFPLVFLIVVSGLRTNLKPAIGVLIISAIILNGIAAKDFIQNSQTFIGKDQISWLFLKNMAQKMYASTDNNFGYFVYAPDTFAFQPKYALAYVAKHSSKTSYYFEKKAITYVVIAPPPENDKFMTENWWMQNKLHLTKKPDKTMLFENGYKIERFVLTPEEINVTPDSLIDPGLHFR